MFIYVILSKKKRCCKLQHNFRRCFKNLHEKQDDPSRYFDLTYAEAASRSQSLSAGNRPRQTLQSMLCMNVPLVLPFTTPSTTSPSPKARGLLTF